MAAPDLLEAGIYTVAQAAYLVGVSKQKARGWIAGYPRRKVAPIIQNEVGWSGKRLACSFQNLMEMRFIAYFEEAGVSFTHIRSIMAEVREVTQVPHPFATSIVFKTDGKKIVGEIVSKTTDREIYDLKTRNLELTTIVYDTLKNDVIYDPNGNALSWYPRRKLAPNVIVHPRFSFGRPILRTSRIPTRTLADAVDAEGSVATVAELFELPKRQVLEAVRFEEELRRAA